MKESLVPPHPSPARQAEITRVAAALFNEKGFHQSSMDDVAEAVGIKKPTLYHYVQSKAQIVAWIHDECVQAVLPPLKSYIKQELSAAEVLYRVACDIFGLLEQKPGYLRIYFENHRDLDRRSQTRIAKKRDEYYGLVKEVLEQGTAAGELQVEDSTLTSLTFFGMCNWGYQWYRPGGPRSSDEIARYVWRGFMAGVLAPGREIVIDQNAVTVSA
jgi:AcrR family transcriptional regulator